VDDGHGSYRRQQLTIHFKVNVVDMRNAACHSPAD
jgi:hypothetical protein